MQSAVRTLHEGDVVWLGRALEKGDRLVATTVEQLFGEPKVEHLSKEPGRFGHLLGVHQQMIDARWSYASRPIAIGGGFTSGSRPPTLTTSCTSSISWPDGTSKRIDSPWPISSPAPMRCTGYQRPRFETRSCRDRRQCSTLKANRSKPTLVS